MVPDISAVSGSAQCGEECKAYEQDRIFVEANVFSMAIFFCFFSLFDQADCLERERSDL